MNLLTELLQVVWHRRQLDLVSLGQWREVERGRSGWGLVVVARARVSPGTHSNAAS